MTPEIPSTYSGALRSIQDREYLQTRKYRSQQWTANRIGCDPQILLFEKMLVRRMGKLGVPMFCSEALRDPERQKKLFALGNSKIKEKGAHTVGCAVDVVHSLKGWDMEKDPEANRKAWALVGHVGKEIIAQEGLEITWGGDFRTFYDPAHWERTDWRDYAIGQDFPF